MDRNALLGKALLALLAEFAVFAAALFVSAGTLLWPAGWAFMALFFGFALAMVLYLAREDPGLLAERLAPPIQRGQPPWDRAFVAAVLPLFLAWLVVMPLDAVRFGWSGVPTWLQLLGAVGLVLSFCVMFLTFRENPYLALAAKLQEGRGQGVVSTGPYRYVRHPLYASAFLFLPGGTLLLGSWWGLLPAAAVLGLIVWRIPLEERMLEGGLAGYDEYERDVRYRLVPRVW
jgi:protein-S-isoprenylcysteine O-methyltransferase Ste14